MLEEMDANCSTYTHFYPICVRRVLPDDTLISMSSGKVEPRYAISLIGYERRGDLAKDVCRKLDWGGVFRGGWIERVLFDGK